MRLFQPLLALSLFGIASFIAPSTIAHAGTGSRAAIDDNREPEQPLSELLPLNSKTIASIKIEGLVRTRTDSVVALLRQKVGESFDAELWSEGTHNLYNTWVLYDLHTRGDPDPIDPSRVHLVLSLQDKWTFFPFAYLQTGGGLANYGAGVIDFNFGGNFTNAFLGLSVLNGQFSYEINFSQDWIGGSDWLGWIDLARNVTPWVTIDGVDGKDFTWTRIQKEVLIGKRISPTSRAFVFADFFNDSVLNHVDALRPRILDGEQYKLRPSVVSGRINLSNYLENGRELAVSPTTSNFFGGPDSYSSLTVTYKHIATFGRDNVAVFTSLNGMTAAPLPYQFHVGGFDSVRGFSAFRMIGRYSVYGNAEYRPYLFQVKSSFLDIDRLVAQGCFFVDSGRVWGSSDPTGEGPVDRAQSLVSSGVGLRVFLLHYAGAILRIDYGRTLSPDEGFGLSFGVSQFF